MEKISSAQEDLLLGYLDGTLNGTQVIELKKQLDNSTALQERLEELRSLNESLMSAHSALESPSSLFVNRVMKNLHSKSYSNALSPRNGLLLLGGVVIAVVILLAMVSTGMFDQTGVISLDKVVPVKDYFQQSLPVVSVNGKLIIKIIIGLNMALVFIVLDRTVLKPFFQRRAGMQL
jgi:hypothetical protein